MSAPVLTTFPPPVTVSAEYGQVVIEQDGARVVVPPESGPLVAVELRGVLDALEDAR